MHTSCVNGFYLKNPKYWIYVLRRNHQNQVSLMIKFLFTDIYIIIYVDIKHQCSTLQYNTFVVMTTSRCINGVDYLSSDPYMVIRAWLTLNFKWSRSPINDPLRSTCPLSTYIVLPFGEMYFNHIWFDTIHNHSESNLIAVHFMIIIDMC